GRRRAQGRGCRGSGPGFLRPWHDGHELVEEHLHCWHSPRGEGDPQVAAPSLVFGRRRRWRPRSCCCCCGGSPPPAVSILGTPPAFGGPRAGAADGAVGKGVGQLHPDSC
ncbi:unnamed protein product, partial [Ectocarpus sp. 4 AP-2014]